MRVEFRPPTDADLAALAATMRAIDVKECALISGLGPREALDACMANACWAVAAEVAGAVVCIFGLSEDFLGEEAHPWMLCADGIERHARTLLEEAPRFVGDMARGYQRLANVVHADNRSAIRFLKWCGFEFGEVFHVKSEPFLPFAMAGLRAAEAA